MGLCMQLQVEIENCQVFGEATSFPGARPGEVRGDPSPLVNLDDCGCSGIYRGCYTKRIPNVQSEVRICCFQKPRIPPFRLSQGLTPVNCNHKVVSIPEALVFRSRAGLGIAPHQRVAPMGATAYVSEGADCGTCPGCQAHPCAPMERTRKAGQECLRTSPSASPPYSNS